MAVGIQDKLRIQRLCWMLYLSGFLDVGGVAMVIALFPGRIRDAGASTTITGLIGSIYGGMQLFTSPMMGKWADGRSRKTSLLISLGFSAFGYYIMASSPSIIIIAISRVVLGFFKHSQTLSKAYLADVLPEKEQNAVMGRFNSFSSLGFIVGPIIGGHIAESSWGFSMVAFLTASTFFLNFVIVWLFIPHSHSHNSKRSENLEADSEKLIRNGNSQEMEGEKKSNKNTGSSFVLLEFWDLFLIILFGSFSMILYRYNFSLLLREKFLASPKTVGYITSYTGLVSMLSGFAMGKITESYKNDNARLFKHATIFQVIVLSCLSIAPSIPFIVVFLTPLSLITSIGRVTSTSVTIHRCGKDKVASVMGWSQSVTSVARMMAPFVVGVAQEWSMDTACYISVLGVVASLMLMVAFPQGSRREEVGHKQNQD